MGRPFLMERRNDFWLPQLCYSAMRAKAKRLLRLSGIVWTMARTRRKQKAESISSLMNCLLYTSTEGHKSPGQCGFSEDDLRAPGAYQQSAFPCAAEMETETPVFQRGKSGCKTGRKDRKENRCRFGNCDPAGGAVCDPPSRGGAGPAPAVAALFSSAV